MNIFCSKCGLRILDPENEPRLALAWVEPRKGGGANQAVMPEYRDEWAHRSCLDRERPRKGGMAVSARQEAMW